MSRGNRDWHARAQRQADKQRHRRAKRAAEKADADPVKRVITSTGALVSWYPAEAPLALAGAPRPPRPDPLHALQFDVWVPKTSLPKSPDSAPVHLANDDRSPPQPVVHSGGD